MKGEDNKYYEEVLDQNEIRTNIFMSILSICISLLFIFYSLTLDYTVDDNGSVYQLCLIIFQTLLITGPVLCLIYRGRKPWLKYLILFSFILSSVFSVIFTESGLYVIIMMVPVISSCLYYRPKLTFLVGMLSIVTLLITDSLIALKFPILYPDLNFAILEEGFVKPVDGYVYYDLMHAPMDRVSYYIEMCKYLLIPLFIAHCVIVFICCMITKRAKAFVMDQAGTLREKIANESDLKLASSIQKSMLPKKGEDSTAYKVSYYIAPAKQVGGDFYDFFKISETKTALIIADVSDKGVPASLFMAVCKTLLSSSLLAGNSLKETVNKVNKTLCNNNSSGMFVTAFICIVDTSTGEVEYVNAGHCQPIVMKNNKEFIYQDVHVDLFLGAMDDIQYDTHKFVLHDFEKLLLYTDGITEAANKKDELFGKDRLISFLNNNTDLNNDELIKKLISAIEFFADGAEQSDDITLLVFSREA